MINNSIFFLLFHSLTSLSTFFVFTLVFFTLFHSRVQPDVLEALVQAGADLQARTKNGETPLDICEDPELKERIIQLKSEMETKRACTSHKLKRSHSSNTRSQSVRRTSIREKSQISRREAREEGRLRQEKGQVLTRTTDEEDDSHANTNGNGGSGSIRSNVSDLSSSHQGHNSDNHVIDLKSIELILGEPNSSSSTTVATTGLKEPCMDPSANDRVDSLVDQSSSSVRTSGDLSSPTYSVINKANQEIALESMVGHKSQLSNGHSPLNNSIGNEVKNRSEEPLPNNNNHLISRQSSRESVKVEIHVTVNTSNPAFAAGTLADLKKLRSDQRKGSERTLNVNPCESSFDTLPPGITIGGLGGGGSSGSGGSGSNNNLPCSSYLLDTQTASSSACPGALPPPSPSNTLKRFRGDPSEVVGGGDSTKQGCCTIS